MLRKRKVAVFVALSVMFMITAFTITGCAYGKQTDEIPETTIADIVIETEVAAELTESIELETNDAVSDDTELIETETENTEPPVVYLDYESGEFKDYYKCSNGVDINYSIRIPENMTVDMPLIVFLHGQGELGRGLPENYGAIKAANEIGEERFVIIQPFAIYAWHVPQQTEMVMELIDAIVEQYEIDENRVILTGHSLGAIGAWYYAEYYTDKLAAVVPVSTKSAIPFSNLINSNLPVWAFCSTWDGESNIQGIKNTIKKLEETGTHLDVRVTEIASVQHGEMAHVPYTDEFFDWSAERVRQPKN